MAISQNIQSLHPLEADGKKNLERQGDDVHEFPVILGSTVYARYSQRNRKGLFWSTQLCTIDGHCCDGALLLRDREEGQTGRVVNLTQTQVDISHPCFSKICKMEKQVRSVRMRGFSIFYFITCGSE